MSIKFSVLGGGAFWVFGGGGGQCRFYFYGRADFSDLWHFIHTRIPRVLLSDLRGGSCLPELHLQGFLALSPTPSIPWSSAVGYTIGPERRAHRKRNL